MLDLLRNIFLNRWRYKTHSEAVIVSCFFNPQKNPYRLIAFQLWYKSIKHLNHRIIECVIDGDEPQLPDSPYITRVYSDSVLWHKESLINNVVAELPSQFKYVFWVDADVLFENHNWLVDGVKQLQESKIIQLFEYCTHLEKNKLYPTDEARTWRSFSANVADFSPACDSLNYDEHGHVGFAWGARREVLEACPLYDRALVGGADHIIAHAAAGQIPHNCITKSFSDNIDEVNRWSHLFNEVVGGKQYIGYVKGNLYHIWHGDIKKRQYLQRIKEFTPESKNITTKDKNGLHKAAKGQDKYVRDYFNRREVDHIYYDDFYELGFDDYEFLNYMGYSLIQQLRYWDDNEELAFNTSPDYSPEPMYWNTDVQPEAMEVERPEDSVSVPDVWTPQDLEGILEPMEAIPDENQPLDAPMCEDDETFS